MIGNLTHSLGSERERGAQRTKDLNASGYTVNSNTKAKQIVKSYDSSMPKTKDKTPINVEY